LEHTSQAQQTVWLTADFSELQDNITPCNHHGRIVIIVIFFSVAVVWLLSNEDIGIYR
jgi:hypothetical protein